MALLQLMLSCVLKNSDLAFSTYSKSLMVCVFSYPTIIIIIIIDDSLSLHADLSTQFSSKITQEYHLPTATQVVMRFNLCEEQCAVFMCLFCLFRNYLQPMNVLFLLSVVFTPQSNRLVFCYCCYRLFYLSYDSSYVATLEATMKCF